MDWRAVLADAQATPPDRELLDRLVHRIWPGAGIRGLELLPGGLSSVLHRVDLTGAPVRAVVLRQLLQEFGHGAEHVRREVAAHDAACAHGVPAPSVHWSDPDGVALGRPALLLDLVPGRPLVAGLATGAGRHAMAAALHALARIPGAGMSSIPRLGDLEAVATHFWPPGPSEVVDVEALQGDVEGAADAFESGGALVHMDLHGGNVLWDGSVVTGILDWAGAAVGNPLADEAYLWFDTCLAHGQDVGDALQRTIDRTRPGPAPTPGAVRLWRGLALQRGLPTPRPWGEAYRAMGIDIDDDTIEERFVALVEGHLGRT